MATRPIFIEHGNLSNDTLLLSDHGHTRARSGDTILWKIRNGSGVYAIVGIEEKKGSYDIFSRNPYEQGATWRGDIRDSAPDYARYRYSILWRASKNGRIRQHDPIISIKPSTTGFGTALLFLAATAAVGFAAYKFYQYLKRKRAAEQMIHESEQDSLT